MEKQNSAIKTILVIIAITGIIGLCFFVFAYLQRRSDNEREKQDQLNASRIKKVEMQCHEAEEHIKMQDSTIQALTKQVKLLQRSRH
jgi:uncharacterized protein HemX